MTQYLCKISDIAEGGKEVCINAESGPVYVMLFPYAGTVRAYLNVCPHQGMPLNWAPDKFMFTGQGFLICAHHGARFDLDTGACVGGACRGAYLQKVDISLDEDSVWLEQIPG
jgi:nitrite reductase/ring-hydroxylating ferredoxin subunit